MDTIDNIIIELKKIKEVHGGDKEIAIKDPDSGWHMKIRSISESSSTKGRFLIRGCGYDIEDILHH